MKAESGLSSPEYPSTGHIVEKQTVRGMCPVDAGDEILSPDCCWTSEVVECVSCVLSQLKVSPTCVFCELESQCSNITFRVPYQEVLSGHFSFYILDFHFTPILKTLKASLALLILDVQHALPFPGTVSSCPELPLTLLCWLSPPLPFNSLSGIIFQDCLSEPPPLLQAHVCFHSTTYTIPLLPDCSGVSHLDWEFTGGRRHTCQLQLDPSPQTTAL